MIETLWHRLTIIGLSPTDSNFCCQIRMIHFSDPLFYARITVVLLID